MLRKNWQSQSILELQNKAQPTNRKDFIALYFHLSKMRWALEGMFIKTIQLFLRSALDKRNETI
jgi:hypothetical protein